jgi:hypothetical protein
LCLKKAAEQGGEELILLNKYRFLFEKEYAVLLGINKDTYAQNNKP